MKKSLYLLAFLLLPFSGNSNAPVIDISQISASFLNFLQSLEAAIETTEKIAKGLSRADTTIKRLQAIKDVYDKINPFLQNVQTIREVTQKMYGTIEVSKSAYEVMRRSKYFTSSEVIFCLDRYDFILRSMSDDVNLLSSLLKPDAWRMNDKERRDATRQSIRLVEAKQTLAREQLLQIMLTEQNRKLADLLWENGRLLTPFSYMKCFTDMSCLKLPVEIEIQSALSGILQPDEGEKNEDPFSPDKVDPGQELSNNQMTSKNRGNYENMFRLGKRIFYGVCAFMALFGALRVYRKIQAGEDFVGQVAAWVFGILLVYGIGELISIFFFGI